MVKVTASWLKKNINRKNIKVVDASWYVPNIKRNPKKEYENSHISGSVFFDIDKICDHNTKLPHMVPSKRVFENFISLLGIKNRDTIIVYCKEGINSSPRVWWLFNYFGHKKIFILDGGFNAWRSISGKIQKKRNIKLQKTNYKTSRIKKNIIINYIDLKDRLNLNNNSLVLDARPENRFKGIEDEPRKNIGKGSIPNSINVPFDIIQKNGYLKSKFLLRKIFSKIIIKNKQLVCSCGSGIAACNLAISLNFIGVKNWSVYDGSWTEWFLKINS